MTAWNRARAHLTFSNHRAPAWMALGCALALAGASGQALAQQLPGAAAARAGTPVSAPRWTTAELAPVNVPGTTPMAAAALDLAAAGYTEREFYASGQAQRYRGVLPGAQATGQVIDGGWPYRTRVLVRTPRTGHFNGTLVVEWANVTAGQDIDFAFAESYAHLLRAGYAVAVVSAQRLGVDRLKTWRPQRYGDLDVAADNLDPQTGDTLDQCPPGTACPGDPLSWDIITQVAQALKDNAAPAQPLGGLKVRQLLALGESQSAMRLSLYYNAIQPIYQVFDGFVFLDLAQQLRADVPTPAISVNSESLAGFLPPVSTSRYTRVWEVAGASHASFYAVNYVDRMLLRDQSMPGPNGPLGFTQVMGQQACTLQPLFSKVDTGLVLNAAIDGVRRWALSGQPAAPTLQFERDAQGAVRRDATGQVLGGVRLPQFVVPTSLNARNGPSLPCVLAGHHRDLSPAELTQRYGHPSAYARQVQAVMRQAVAQGHVLPQDGQAAIRAAQRLRWAP